MEFLDTISPIDNRYFDKVSEMKFYFSYKSWIKYRILVELKYFKLLYETIPELYNSDITKDRLNKFINISITNQDILDIIEIEKTTHHDIKSIEIWLRNRYDNLKIGSPHWKEYIHFGLTSQDINSIAFSLQLYNSITFVMIPIMDNIIDTIYDKWNNVKIPLLALTHGQPAIPTTLGKEMMVFKCRLEYIYNKIHDHKFKTKIGGAVGTLNAHYIAYPNIDWNKIMDKFCKDMCFERWQYTTQITNYEDICYISSLIVMFNNILIDFCQDIWLYISRKIFILRKESEDQVGSSTMPQKVNPIDFENAEGNLKISNAGLNLIIEKLPISRLQRDLTDSTVLRNYGVYLSHSLLAYKSILKGICKLSPNKDTIFKELNEHPEILGEAIQILMRKYGIPDAYNIIRKASQNKTYSDINEYKKQIIDTIRDTVDTADTADNIINEILKLDFTNY